MINCSASSIVRLLSHSMNSSTIVVQYFESEFTVFRPIITRPLFHPDFLPPFHVFLLFLVPNLPFSWTRKPDTGLKTTTRWYQVSVSAVLYLCHQPSRSWTRILNDSKWFMYILTRISELAYWSFSNKWQLSAYLSNGEFTMVSNLAFSMASNSTFKNYCKIPFSLKRADWSHRSCWLFRRLTKNPSSAVDSDEMIPLKSAQSPVLIQTLRDPPVAPHVDGLTIHEYCDKSPTSIHLSLWLAHTCSLTKLSIEHGTR